MKKQILSLCMVLALCLLPATALAADGDTVYVGGVALTGSTGSPAYATTDDSGNVITEGADENNYNIKWDGSTLTLNGATITGKTTADTYQTLGIYASGSSGNVSLEIELQGKNTITSNGCGIFVHSFTTDDASLTIKGGGSLNASSLDTVIQVMSNGGDATLSIENADVTATSSYGYGVNMRSERASSTSLTVDGGSLTASGTPGILYDSTGSVSVPNTVNLTISNSALVDARDDGIGAGYTENLGGVSPTDDSVGIIFGLDLSDSKAGTVYGDVTLQENLTIGTGENLTLDDGASLNAGGHNVIVDGGTVDDSIKNSLGERMKYTPSITTDSLPSGTVGTFYNQTLAADGTTPITWSVSNGNLPAGLSLNGNTISGTPTAQGENTFTVTAANDYGSDSQAFALTIDEPTVISVTGVSLDKTSLILTEGGSDTLNATVTPDNATNKTVTWESNNTNVATVENGKVTAHSAGTAAITVKTADGGYEVTCFVTVKHGNMTHTPENAATCTEDGNKEYWTCGICGKHFSDAEGKEETSLFDTVVLEKGHSYVDGKCSVCEAIDSGFQPVIITGAGGIWQKGAKAGLSFTSNAAFADFVKIQVDGKDLAASNYEVKEGSTVVTLKTSYLETLSVGKHTLAIVSDTGTAATGFTINAAPVTDDDTQSSQTGDNTNIALWIVMALASGTGLTVTAIYRRKHHFGKR